MGVLTEYFAAQPDQVESFLATGPAGNGVAAADLKEVDPVLTGKLWAVIREGRIDAYRLDAHDPIDMLAASASDNGPWLIRLRDDFAADLAAIPDDRMSQIVAEWIRAEEWHNRVTAAELVDMTTALRAAAHAAQVTGRHLYLWISL